MLDTAALYGTSEQVIGRTLLPAHDFRIVTKTPVSADKEITDDHINEVERCFYTSLDNLQRSTIDGLLVHHGTDLLKTGGGRIIDLMRSLRDQGKVRKVGVSVYDGAEIDAILNLFAPDIIQLPINVFDQKLVESGHLEKLKERDVEVHARSLFLQGAALMPVDALPNHLAPMREAFELLENLSATTGFSKLALCLMFAQQTEGLDVALVGVTLVKELNEIVQAVDAIAGMENDFSKLAINDNRYVNPANWPE